jgi:hypothetical protein
LYLILCHQSLQRLGLGLDQPLNGVIFSSAITLCVANLAYKADPELTGGMHLLSKRA